ncbi:MAG TPA: exodeoxyribonuclease VII large subunit [Bacteroidales bacterium]|nr:exodeoxyribonuclease VII large subunit [Bacteroidales bacterium]HRT89842.1 exodeoxyribonuclease VII large subunit [Bacteroidales bacterium]
MNEKLSLTELQLLIRDSLYTSLPGFFWVFAEIAEAKENFSGHCYLELIEKHPDETNVRARVRAVIWNNRYRLVKSSFESITGERLREGLKILFRAKIEYHEVYGLSLIITDIDPAFTVGEMALRRRQILLKLEEDGVISMNRELELSPAPKRIAVISSKNAAGYNDFIKHLNSNIYGYVFHTALFDAVMQGQETEESIISALNRISEYAGLFDAVAIIRGGGSQSDLSWFDNYNIAYHITQFPLPVLTGIGHEKDLTVTDIVAFHALKTPTAVADYLIERMVSAESILEELGNEISSLASEIIDDKKELIGSWRLRLLPVAGMMLSSERKRLSALTVKMTLSGRKLLNGFMITLSDYMKGLRTNTGVFLKRNQADLSGSAEIIKINSRNVLMKAVQTLEYQHNKLSVLDPLNVLKRGFTLTVKDGEIIKSVEMVNTGDKVTTIFRDGSVTSRVEDRKIKQ